MEETKTVNTAEVPFRNRDTAIKHSKLEKLRETNPHKVPIIFETHPISKIKSVREMKFFCSRNLKIAYFTQEITKKCSLSPETSLYFCCGNNKLIKSDVTIGELFDKYKDSDGYLYVQFREIESLG